MVATRASALFAAASVVAASAMATASPAHGDPDPVLNDPRVNIYYAVDKDVAAAHCDIAENGPLQDAAQAYAASENPADAKAVNFNGPTVAFLGSGDPQAAAINSAYRNGAGAVIQQCKSNKYNAYGAGFLRKDHGNGPVDVVTIVFGVLPPPTPAPPPVTLTPIEEPPLPAVASPPPHGTTSVNAPPAALTATVTSDVDLYDKPNVPDGAGKKIAILRTNTVVKVKAPCPSDDWCLLLDPAGAAWGSFLRND